MALSSLRKFAIKPDTLVPHELVGIVMKAGTDAPVLYLRHAGDTNPAYKSALAKAQADYRAIGSGKGDQARRARALADARMLVAANCVARWENVYEDDGAESPCTPEKIEELLVGLIDNASDVFYGVLGAAINAAAFRATASVDAEQLGKP